MLLGDAGAHGLDEIEVALVSAQDVQDLAMRLVGWQQEVGRGVAIDGANLRVVDAAKQRDRTRRQRFEQTRRHEAEMAEGRAQEHGVEESLAHPGNDLLETDRRHDLDAEFPQVVAIDAERLLHAHRCRPGWESVPAVADESKASETLPRRLDRA